MPKNRFEKSKQNAKEVRQFKGREKKRVIRKGNEKRFENNKFVDKSKKSAAKKEEARKMD
jgi:hypothetical protein